MSSSPTRQGCPSSDDLSSFVDGSAAEELAIHIELCAACQRQVEAFRRIDQAIRRRLAPPAGLSERIRQRVRSDVEERPRGVTVGWWLSPALRLAAALVVTAAALAVLVHLLDRMGTSGPGAPALASGGLAGELRPDASVPGGVQGAEAAVKFVRAPDGRPRDSRTQEAAVPCALPSRVRHVWSVGDADGERRYLASLLEPGSYKVSRQEDGNTVLTAQLSDQQVQDLVDRLYDRKWSLVSSDLPQPKRRESVSFAGRRVDYSVVLVPGGRDEIR